MFQAWWRGLFSRKTTTKKTPTRTRVGLETLEDRCLLTATPLADINPGTDSAVFYGDGGGAAQLNGFTYFHANDGVTGGALWRTDGTPDGTTLVKPLGPVQHLTATNSYLLFVTDDGVHGEEVWVSDGTADGTQLLLDINPYSSSAHFFTVVGNQVFFVANDGVNGNEVWVTDGTTAGTRLTRNIDPSTDYFGGPFNLTAFKGEVYFAASNGAQGYELWASNGVGARLVRDHFRGPESGLSFTLTSFGTPIAEPFVVNGNWLYFAGNDGHTGTELWKTNGTRLGTYLVNDCQGGTITNSDGSKTPKSSLPANLAVMNGKVYFTANDGLRGRNLFVTDGTRTNTRRLTNLRADPNYPASGAGPQHLTVVGSKLYFTAKTKTGGDGLWVYNGASTVFLRALTPAAVDYPSWYPPQPSPLFVAGGKLFFQAATAALGEELWTTDGTVAGTKLVKDLRPGAAGAQLSFLTDVGGRLLFIGHDGSHGRELWLSNGTATGTTLLKDINAAGVGSYASLPVQAGGKLFYVANDGEHGDELWVSDGTARGTRLLLDINPTFTTTFDVGTSPLGSWISNLTALGNVVYFTANDLVHGVELWRSDGTEAGTYLLRDINTLPLTAAPDSPTMDSSPANLVVLDRRLYFTADDGVHGRELWSTMGTPESTVMVRDINEESYWWTGTNTTNPSYPEALTVLKGKLYFRANDGLNGVELWVSNGTPEGTKLVKDINPHLSDTFSPFPLSSLPLELTRLGDYIYFSADDGDHGRELWRTDGTTAGTTLVANLHSDPEPVPDDPLPLPFPPFGSSTFFPPFPSGGPTGSDPFGLTAVGSSLYSMANGDAGLALWKYNGSTDPQPIRTFPPVVDDPYSFGPILSQFTAVGAQLFFTVYDSANGAELWVSNGTEAGTRLVKELAPGSATADPSGFAVLNDKLYFLATTAANGRELWVSNGTEAGTKQVFELIAEEGSSFDFSSGLKAIGNALYFTASDGAHGFEPYKWKP